MKFYKAKVADVLRASQRDEEFINTLQDDLREVFKLFASPQEFNRRKNVIPYVAAAWYYFLTSASNLQTLGEEYAGILRLDRNSKIASKLLQLIWIALYVGGEKLADKLSKKLKSSVIESPTLTPEAKSLLLRILDFFGENKAGLLRLHQALFFMDGIYYNVANRFTGLRYVS